MLPAASVPDFLEAPWGRYVVGRRWVFFAQTKELIGFASWGRPDVDDVRELLRLCELGVGRNAVPHRFLVDLRGLELVDPSTFTMFVEYTWRHREALKKNVVRQAQLRPEGLVGAIISGFSHIARLPYPERVFGDVEEAIGWLGIDRDEGNALLAELTTIRERTSGADPMIRQLRDAFAESPSLSLDRAVARLGTSRRTFQRVLRQAGTSFRLEVAAARMRRAIELLKTSDRNLTWIAAELGFSSVQHFATAFRRALGDSPSAWRSRARETSASPTH